MLEQLKHNLGSARFTRRHVFIHTYTEASPKDDPDWAIYPGLWVDGNVCSALIAFTPEAGRLNFETAPHIYDRKTGSYKWWCFRDEFKIIDLDSHLLEWVDYQRSELA